MSSSVLAPSAARPRLALVRVVALRVVYSLLSLWALAMTAPGPVALVTGSLPDPKWQAAAATAPVFKLLTVGPALGVAWTGGRSVLAVRALVVGQLCWLGASLLAPEDGSSAPARAAQVAVTLLIWVGPWLLVAPRRSSLWREPLVLDRALLAAGLVAAVPLVAWAVAVSGLDVSGGARGFDPREVRFDMVGVPLSLAAAVLLGATHRWRGWVSGTACAWMYVGAVALVMPHRWGSPGSVAGAALVIGGLVLLVHSLRRR